MPDLRQIASTIKAPTTLTNIACTQMFCNQLLDHYASTKGVDLSVMQSTFSKMVSLYATEHGFSAEEVQAVQVSIHMAGKTLAYIDKVPSDAEVDAAIADGAVYKPNGAYRSGVPPAANDAAPICHLRSGRWPPVRA